MGDGMAQTRFQYDYSQQRDAEKNAKRLRSHEFYTVVVYNPKIRRYMVLFCDTDADLPTRVPILAQYRDDPPPELEPEHESYDLLNAIVEMVDQGAITIHIVNNGARVHEKALEDLLSYWIHNQTLEGIKVEE